MLRKKNSAGWPTSYFRFPLWRPNRAVGGERRNRHQCDGETAAGVSFAPEFLRLTRASQWLSGPKVDPPLPSPLTE